MRIGLYLYLLCNFLGDDKKWQVWHIFWINRSSLFSYYSGVETGSPWCRGSLVRFWHRTLHALISLCHTSMQLAHRPALRVERNYEFAAIVVETLKNWTVNMKSFTKTLSSQLVDTSGGPRAGAKFSQCRKQILKTGYSCYNFYSYICFNETW